MKNLIKSGLPSAGALILTVWKFYLERFRSLMRVSLWWLAAAPFMLPAALHSVVGISSTGRLLYGDPSNPEFFWFLAALSAVATVATAVFVRPALVALIYAARVGHDLPARKAFGYAREILFPYALVMVMVGLIVSLGFVLFVVPGLVASVYLLFAEQAAVVEGKRGVEALKRSVELVKGRFWAILWRFFAVNALFYLGVSFIMALFTQAPLAWLAAAATGPISTRSLVSPFLVLASVISALTFPLFMSFQVILFAEVRKLKK